jgi:hypothetical protein
MVVNMSNNNKEFEPVPETKGGEWLRCGGEVAANIT